MKFGHWAAALAALGAVLPAAGADVPADGKPIRVVIIDGQNNHDWRSTTPFMKRVLEETGRFRVAVSTSPQADGKIPAGPGHVAFPPDLDDFDVVLSNYNGAPWPAGFCRALDERLSEGKVALVIVHAANNSFADWPAYNAMIGLGWRENRFGARLTLDANGREERVPKGKGPGSSHGARHPFVVTVRDPDHPITRGMPPEWMHATDELYHGLRGPAEHMHLLATAFSDRRHGGTGQDEPMIWTVAYGRGRVFHTPMGHDLEAMRCVGFITTLRRGTEWAATGKVTQPLPENFPGARQPSSVPEK